MAKKKELIIMKKLKVLFSPNLMKRWCINDAENLDLNPKGDNLTELDQWNKDLYQRMNIKMSNQKCSITFIDRKNRHNHAEQIQRHYYCIFQMLETFLVVTIEGSLCFVDLIVPSRLR